MARHGRSLEIRLRDSGRNFPTQSKISFTIEESPAGRSGSSAMLNEMIAWRREYEYTHKRNSQSFLSEFNRIMIMDYIHNLNQEEMIGTQDRKDTETTLGNLFENPPTSASIHLEKPATKETIGVFEAMKECRTLDKDGFLTINSICKVHNVLLKSLNPNCGKIRTTDSCTYVGNGDLYFYPSPASINGLLYAMIEHHNISMEACQSMEARISRTMSYNKETFEYISSIFKCAAMLLFEFVKIHPYNSGNGRMGRLLANHILSLTTPFPVRIYHKLEGINPRTDYMSAMVNFGKDPDKTPGVIAAMLVEGAWRGWKQLMTNLKQQMQVPLPIVIRFNQIPIDDSDDLGDQLIELYISERIDHIWSHLERHGVTQSKEEVCQLVLTALPPSRRQFPSGHYSTITVNLDTYNLVIDVAN